MGNALAKKRYSTSIVVFFAKKGTIPLSDTFWPKKGTMYPYRRNVLSKKRYSTKIMAHAIYVRTVGRVPQCAPVFLADGGVPHCHWEPTGYLVIVEEISNHSGWEYKEPCVFTVLQSAIYIVIVHGIVHGVYLAYPIITGDHS